MNLPNKLTVLRMILAPLFLALMLIDFPFHYFAALAVFIFASVTDLLDGKIARKQGIVTNFGKFLDPIADKVLTTAAFLGMMAAGMNQYKGVVWIVMIILIREFAVASLRMICAAEGEVIAADYFGKLKTVMQMVAIIMVLAFEAFKPVLAMLLHTEITSVLFLGMDILANVVLWVSAVLTLLSGINYLVKNRKMIDYRK
ncbi:MAG: CDP-diacylglycerol--glycerol-3-phosphate 3-phosphatidyltransferase [Clostridia bacterium]|nr:CDP-diacylglycerol--glycerol-3-phosphate 3-phosphatidyltransferase [Clostridia bacterium]